MYFKKLFDMQETLDNRIIQNHNLCSESLFSKKILALNVEIGELANETRCFKYWSNKKPSPKEVILEEYIDCLHFILSIGIEKHFTDTDNIEAKTSEYKLSDQFCNLYIDVNDFIVCSSKDHYLTLFEDFLTLGRSLKFSDEEIQNSYISKNAVNHKRQDDGY